jgi:hypothetical protein
MEIRIRIKPGWEPEDGDAFDAVVAALDYWEIPSVVTLDDGTLDTHTPARDDTAGPAWGDEWGGEEQAERDRAYMEKGE